MFAMYDLFDLFAPRVYVVSEKQYEKVLAERRTKERELLIARKEELLERVAKLDERIKELEG